MTRQKARNDEGAKVKYSGKRTRRTPIRVWVLYSSRSTVVFRKRYLHDFGDPMDREPGVVVRPRPVYGGRATSRDAATAVDTTVDAIVDGGATARVVVRPRPVRRQRRDGRRACWRVRGLAIRVSASHDGRPMSRDDGTLLACDDGPRRGIGGYYYAGRRRGWSCTASTRVVDARDGTRKRENRRTHRRVRP